MADHVPPLDDPAVLRQKQTDELIAAWIDWDAAAGRPPRYPSALTLEAEVQRLSAAERVLGMPLGYTARIAALRWRRDATGEVVKGMDVGDAVQTVVLELAPPPTARVDQLPRPHPDTVAGDQPALPEQEAS